MTLDFQGYVDQAWQITTGWEMLAVVLAIAYLILAIKVSIWCWPAALLSTLIYVFLFFDVNLYMESVLQIFYIIMAIYGWMQWHSHTHKKDNLLISHWTISQHTSAISLILILVLISGFLLERNTNAAYPWLDSFTTWGAVITTWMVTKKIIDNWWYWIILDAVSVFLYLQRDLYLTALLFILYVLLCFVGYNQWQKRYLIERAL